MQKADDVRRLLSVLRNYTTFGHWFPADLAQITIRTLEGLLKERDAAVDDLKDAYSCFACRQFYRNGGQCSGGSVCDRIDFEWRGVQKEG